MNISFDEKTKLYTAYQVSDNKPCIAFNESRLVAEQFCFELIEKNRNQLLEKFEGHHTAISFKDNDFDYGDCTGYTIKDLGITIYTYANDSNRVSIHQEDCTDYRGEDK